MSSKIWFTSDTHFNHFNVIKYSNRPWDNVEDMNAALIERWNSCVKPNDTVYHLGDLCLTTKIDLVDGWLGQLNGTIRLIKGNHDQWVKKILELKNVNKIKWVREYEERTFSVGGAKYKFILSHYPMLFWNGGHWGSIMLHGHCHGNNQDRNVGLRRMDVGVDCNDWYPVSLESIVAQLGNLPINKHHERDEND